MFLTCSVYTPPNPRVKSPVWVLLRLRSGTCAFRLTLAASSPLPSPGVLSGSGVLEAETWAVLVKAPGTSTLAVNDNVVLPTGSVPTVQTPALNPPVAGLLEISVKPAGSCSATTTPVASLGPALVKVMVYTTFCPTAGAGLSTVLVKLKSLLELLLAVVLEVLLAGCGSLVGLVMVAVLVMLLAGSKLAGTLYVAVMTLVEFGARMPKLHGKALVQSPVFETNVKPAGVGSFNSTLAALLGPAFLSVTV
jgi:hypothetical protein